MTLAGNSLLKTDRYVAPTEQQLTVNRAKPKSLTVGVIYRLVGIGTTVFGKERMARLMLNSSRLFGRFAFELTSEKYGENFHNVSMALSEDILRRHIPTGGTVVDVGCGYGRASRMAGKYATSVTGIDYDGNLIGIAQRLTTSKNVEFVHGDVTKDLGGKKFGLALLIHVIEHIDDADKILKILLEVSNKIIVEVPDFESDPLNLVRFDQGLQFYSDGDHVREYTEDILTDQLTRNGWTIIETRKNGGAVLAVAEAQK